MCSSFIKAVKSVCVEDVDCCRLLCALERSSFIETYESVVAEDVCCRLHYVLWISLVLLKLLNLLLKLLIVVGYYVIWRTLVLLNLLLKLLIVTGYYEL